MQNSNLTSTELEKRLAIFEKECRCRGLRITSQRREIFKTVAVSHQHPSAEVVFSHVRQVLPNVSLDTVYRTLASLEDMNLLIKIGTISKERFDGDMRPHAHFVCSRCGEVYDVFPSDVPCEIKPSILKVGKVKRISIQFQGICNKCDC